jgi:hypothetical protein
MSFDIYSLVEPPAHSKLMFVSLGKLDSSVILVTLPNRRLWIRRQLLAALRAPLLGSSRVVMCWGAGSLMFERVLMVRRCRKRAAEWNNRAEAAITAEERCGHLMVADHYRALAESAERSLHAAWERRFPRMLTA